MRLTLLQVLHIAASECNADFVQFRGGQGGPSRVIVFFSFSDVTHF
jgi:hypothetical protein